MPSLNAEDLPHYTYDDYKQWEGKWEVIQGIPYAIASPVKKHQRVSLKIAAQLDLLLELKNSSCEVYETLDWQVAEDTVVRPDVLVSCEDNGSDKKLLSAPVMVFEILSPSTRKKDKGLKYRIYQEAGVKYYCIVDLETDSLEAFQLSGKLYRKDDDFKEGKMMFEFNGITIALDVGKIFGR